MSKLESYQQWLLNHAKENPYSSRPETPESLEVKTLWIPVWSGNRTACIDLNHEIASYKPKQEDCEAEWTKKFEFLVGYNGNCATPYVVVEIPLWWTMGIVDILSENVTKRLNKASDYDKYRVLKADYRMDVIIEEIEKMSEKIYHL